MLRWLLPLLVAGCGSASTIELGDRVPPIDQAVPGDLLTQRWANRHRVEVAGIDSARPVGPLHPAGYQPTWRETFDATARQRGVGWRTAGTRRVVLDAEPAPLGFTIDGGPPVRRIDAGNRAKFSVEGVPVALVVERLGDVSGIDDEAARRMTLPDGEPATLGPYPALMTEVLNADTNAALRTWAVSEGGRRFKITAAQRLPETTDLPTIFEVMLDSFRVGGG